MGECALKKVSDKSDESDPCIQVSQKKRNS